MPFSIKLLQSLALVFAVLASNTALGQYDDLGGGYGDFNEDFGGFGDSLDAGPGLGNQVTVTAQFTQATAERPAVLMITAIMQGDWHIYSLTQPDGGPQATEITLTPSDSYKLAGDFASHPKPDVHFDDLAFKMNVEEHYGEVTWYVPIEIAEGVDPASLEISGEVDTQACKQACVPLTLPFTAKVGSGVPIGPLDAPQEEAATEPVEEQTDSLAYVLGLAVVGGFILNFMPCVLPVIGLKIMSFVNQAGQSRVKAFWLNVWYTFGILLVFWVLAALAIFLGNSWGSHFGNVGFNITISSIVFALALSMLGVWEIPIPGFAGSGKAQDLADKEGPLGALMKGVFTTILATPCTGPGVGYALGWTLKQPAAATFSVFTAIGLGMALPYLAIGLFPSLIKFLPKPGAWMETFKQLMGFVLLATVVWFLNALPKEMLLPTLGMFVVVGLASWIYSKTPLTASTNEKMQTYMLCTAVLVGGAVLNYAVLFAEEEDWPAFTAESLDKALGEEQVVLVDFSADWCTSCKALERTVLHTDSVREAMESNGVVAMYADFTEQPPWMKKVLNSLGANGVPVIAIYSPASPDKPTIFNGFYTKSGLIEAIEKAAAETSMKPAEAEVATLPALSR